MYDSFYGWYLKCQSDSQTLAVIPAVHKAGRKTCSIQIITDHDAWTVTFPADEFQRTKRNIFIGENRFGKEGIRLAIHTPQLTVEGKCVYQRTKICFSQCSGILGRRQWPIVSQRVYLDAMLFS